MNDGNVTPDFSDSLSQAINADAKLSFAAQSIWHLKEPNSAAAESLSRAVGISPLTAQVLLHRQVTTPEDAEVFLDPDPSRLADPYILPDMDKAVDRLCQAIKNKEPIFLHGDFDADGVTSTAICWRALSILNANVAGTYIPQRSDSHDLQQKGVDAAKVVGASLILTADCGTNAGWAIEYARSLGIEVIVTDHHHPETELPNAVAIVNPYREDAQLKFREYCGAGVVYRLFEAVMDRLMPGLRDKYRERFADLAALGTIADVTPLIGENRILVVCGLQALKESRKPGIRALLAGLDKKDPAITSRTISHGIAPLINAASRVEDGNLALRLLTTKDDEEAIELARKLAELRETVRGERERVSKEALLEAMMPEHQGKRVLVLARERWGRGILGLAANIVAEHHRKPVIMLSYDAQAKAYHGSARSYGDYKILPLIAACRDIIGNFGGHSAAAGMSVSAENLELFRERINEVAEGIIPEVPEPLTIEIDAEVPDLNQLTYTQMEELERLAPFGTGNAEPVFVTNRAYVLETKRVGADGQTLQMRLRMPGRQFGMKAVRFRDPVACEQVQQGTWVDIVYTPKFNYWDGKTNIELMVADLRPSA